MKRKKERIFEFYDEESPVATEFRRLHSRIRRQFANPQPSLENKGRALLITSATRGEGKTTTASYLALTSAKYQETKTLLVDCDLRKPKIHELFGLRRDGGLSEIISGKLSIDSGLKSTEVENLKILTSGVPTAKPSLLIDSKRMRELFKEIRSLFDFIIVDCAPIIPVSDPLLLSTELDGVILVVMAGKTPREVVKRANDLLKDARSNLLGVVVNNVEEVLPYYYDYKYYGYKPHKTESLERK